MKLNRCALYLAVSLASCATAPDRDLEIAPEAATRIEWSAPAREPLLLGRLLESPDAPCDGFPTMSYSAESPDSTRRLLCVSREELAILYAPEAPPQESAEMLPPDEPQFITIFEVENLAPDLEIRDKRPEP